MRGATRVVDVRGCRHGDFNPRAPCGARLARYDHTYQQGIISIHAPHAGRDRRRLLRPKRGEHFNPRAPCGARRMMAMACMTTCLYFNPRAPCGARRGVTACLPAGDKDFNPRAPCGARLNIRQIQRVELGISIHAPHAGRDLQNQREAKPHYHFNPRAPCGARLDRAKRARAGGHFNPRAPCGARLHPAGSVYRHGGFQSTRPMRGATCRRSSGSF